MNGEGYALTVARNDRRVVEASWDMTDDERDRLILAVIRAAAPSMLGEVADQIRREADTERDNPPRGWDGASYWEGVTAGKGRAEQIVRAAAKEQK